MMSQTNKSFDCVEMKNKIQADMQAEYESRQHEFNSFVEFVKASAANSDYARAMREHFQPNQSPLTTASR
jgi:hypothetical protein